MSKIEICIDDPIKLLYMVGQFYSIEHVNKKSKKEVRNYYTLELVNDLFSTNYQPLIKYLNSHYIDIYKKFKDGEEEFYRFFNNLKEKEPDLFTIK